MEHNPSNVLEIAHGSQFVWPWVNVTVLVLRLLDGTGPVLQLLIEPGPVLQLLVGTGLCNSNSRFGFDEDRSLC